MATNNVDIAIRAKNEASGAIRQVKAELAGLDEAAQSAAGGLSGLGQLLTGGLIAGGLMMLADQAIGAAGAIYDLGKSGAAAQALEDSFDDLAASVGASAAQMLDALRGASQGMIADQELILAANRSILLGVADTSEEMAQLLQVATARGKAMGLSATQAFNDLVTGLGRMSPMILDNLGIVTGGEKVFADYAEAIGKSADALTDAERKAALFNKVISESADLVEQGISANPFAQLEAGMSNLQTETGQLLAPIVSEFAAVGARAATELTGILQRTAAAELPNIGQQIGYGIGDAISGGIVEALSMDSGEIGDLLYKMAMDWNIATLGLRIGNEWAQGTLQALEERAGEIGQAYNAAISGNAGMETNDYGLLGNQTPERMAAFEELRRAQNELAAATTDMLAKFDGYFRLQELGSTQAASRVREIALAAAENVKGLKTAYEEAARAVGAMQGPLLQNEAAARQGGASWQTFSGAVNAGAAAERAAGPAISATTGQILAQSEAALQAAASLKSFYLAQVSALGAAQAYAGFQNSQAALGSMEGYWKSRGFSTEQIEFERAQFLANQQRALQAQIAESQRQIVDLTNLSGNVRLPVPNADETKRGARTQAEYLSALRETNDETDRGGRAAVSAGERLTGALGYSRRSTDDLRTAMGELGDATVEALGGGGGGGGAAGAVDALGMSLDDLRGKVQSVLSGALDPGVGLNAEDLLPREDDINENARRLADIAANGFKGQEWLAEFKAEAPGVYQDIMDQVAAGVDAKTAAARILRDFEAGLRPELIDKELVKERVKRMIVGEQNMAALAEEIAQELAAEMGIPLQEALAAAGASMGVATGAAGRAAAEGTEAGDMTSGGALAGQTFMAGFLANADGAALIAGMIGKLNTEMPRFLEAGKGAGTQWGAGFMLTVESGIAMPLIQLLTTLVTPNVMAQMAAQQSQMEAP